MNIHPLKSKLFVNPNCNKRCVCIICVPMTMLLPHLVLLDSTIDATDEGVGGIETNCPCQQPEPNSHDKCVAKVEHCGD